MSSCLADWFGSLHLIKFAQCSNGAGRGYGMANCCVVLPHRVSKFS